MDAALGWPRRLAPHGLPWARWVMADGEVLGLALAQRTVKEGGRQVLKPRNSETLAQVSIQPGDDQVALYGRTAVRLGGGG